jgi:hypothetical protein
MSDVMVKDGDRAGSRTRNLGDSNPPLYPIELRGHRHRSLGGECKSLSRLRFLRRCGSQVNKVDC